jgi:hypothetical protein
VLLVSLSVGWLVIISRKAVSKKRRKECIVCVRRAYPSCCRLRGYGPIYIPLEGLCTPKPIPNLDVKSSGPIYPTTVVIKKCEFFTRKIDFIRFIIKLGYISIDLKKVKTIVD